jgi:threonine aldolase
VTGPVDLRSDTVTRPTAEMRRAMAAAEVGDDWYGDDPTVNRLQDRVAELTGMPAALYLPTGTMCNQVAVHAFARAGHVVVCAERSHVCGMEAASAAVLSGITFHRVAAPRGLLTAAQVTAALRPDPYDVTVADLVTLENTHQVGGGAAYEVTEVEQIAAACAARRVPLYLDGARVFNACAATGAAVADYAAHVTAMMFCLSKGLGAPIGSVLAGSGEFIAEARRLKILFGGAWRQAGIMAAAGLVALAEGPERLAEDHAHARRLADGLAELLPGSVRPQEVQTNIVFADVTATGLDAEAVAGLLAAEGLLVTMIPPRIRMLTHRDVSAADIGTALAAWRGVIRDLAAI